MPGPATAAPRLLGAIPFFFYDPDDRESARRMPFATIVVKDYPGFDETRTSIARACSASTSRWGGQASRTRRARSTTRRSTCCCHTRSTRSRVGCRRESGGGDGDVAALDVDRCIRTGEGTEPVIRFRTTIELGGKKATGFRVPDHVVEQLGSGRKPKVVVEIGGRTYTAQGERERERREEREREREKRDNSVSSANGYYQWSPRRSRRRGSGGASGSWASSER